MLEMLKRFWSKSSDTNTVAAPRPAAKPGRTVTVVTRPGGSTAAPRTPAPAKPGVAAAKAAAKPTTPAVRSSIEGTVSVTLGAIEPSLPEQLRHKIAGALNEVIPVPARHVMPQLARGTVTMTVQELRACAPDLLACLTGHDDIAVALPLGEIVPQLDRSCFARREDVRKLQVPDDVTSVFTPGGSGTMVISQTVPAGQTHRPAAAPVQPSTAAPRPAAQPATRTSAPTPTAAPAPKISAPSLASLAAAQTPKPAAKPEAAAVTPPAPAAPEAPAQSPEPERRISLSADALAALAAAAPAKSATPAKPVTPAPSAVAPAAAGLALPKPNTPAPAQTASAAPPKSAPRTPSTPTLTSEPLPLPLTKIADLVPQEIRSEIADVDVPATTLYLPMPQVEAGLKSGKVLFSWGELASWLQPPLPRPPSRSLGDILVELPLKVIAPAFMAHHRASSGQKKADVGQNIPDLFYNGASGAEAPATAPAAPAAAQPPAEAARTTESAAPRRAAASVREPAVARTATPNGAPAQPNLEQIIGPAENRLAPKQIVINASKLPGINGALLALSDGLTVTSALPESAKPDTVAAFLPQMFGRMSQYTKELGMGPLQSMALNVEGGCWQVFKQPNIYFAVSGKAGEPMPLNLLTQIAAELSKQTV